MAWFVKYHMKYDNAGMQEAWGDQPCDGFLIGAHPVQWAIDKTRQKYPIDHELYRTNGCVYLDFFHEIPDEIASSPKACKWTEVLDFEENWPYGVGVYGPANAGGV